MKKFVITISVRNDRSKKTSTRKYETDNAYNYLLSCFANDAIEGYGLWDYHERKNMLINPKREAKSLLKNHQYDNKIDLQNRKYFYIHKIYTVKNRLFEERQNEVMNEIIATSFEDTIHDRINNNYKNKFKKGKYSRNTHTPMSPIDTFIHDFSDWKNNIM